MIFLLFCQYSGFRRIRFLFTLRNRAISLPGDPHSLISQVTFGRGSTIIAGSRVILSDEKMKPEDLVCASASEQPGVILEEGMSTYGRTPKKCSVIVIRNENYLTSEYQ